MTTRPSWDDYFLAIAQAVALRADCSVRQVGAVIVRANRIVSAGYNGSPAGQPGCLSDGACPRAAMPDPEDGGDRKMVSYDGGPGSCIAVHAEANAIIYADRDHCEGAVIYVTADPCPGCRKLIAGAGIARIVIPAPVREKVTA